MTIHNDTTKRMGPGDTRKPISKEEIRNLTMKLTDDKEIHLSFRDTSAVIVFTNNGIKSKIALSYDAIRAIHAGYEWFAIEKHMINPEGEVQSG